MMFARRSAARDAPEPQHAAVHAASDRVDAQRVRAWVLPFACGFATALLLAAALGALRVGEGAALSPALLVAREVSSHAVGAPTTAAPAPAASAGGCEPAGGPLLWTIGLRTGTDKVTTTAGTGHPYQFPYEKYMRPLRCRPINVLEIGLGCDMGIGEAGHSVAMWLDFLPTAALTVMEWNSKCMADWRAADPMRIGKDVLDARVQFFEGDQSKLEDLLRVANARGPFDVIIDDGGHSANQQITSLRTLLPLVKPGGLYVLEDLGTSFSPNHAHWHDFPTTAAAYTAQMINCIHWPTHAATLDVALFPGLAEIVLLVKSIDCSRELCVFTRWAAGEGPSVENANKAAAAGS